MGSIPVEETLMTRCENCGAPAPAVPRLHTPAPGRKGIVCDSCLAKFSVCLMCQRRFRHNTHNLSVSVGGSREKVCKECYEKHFKDNLALKMCFRCGTYNPEILLESHSKRQNEQPWEDYVDKEGKVKKICVRCSKIINRCHSCGKNAYTFSIQTDPNSNCIGLCFNCRASELPKLRCFFSKERLYVNNAWLGATVYTREGHKEWFHKKFYNSVFKQCRDCGNEWVNDLLDANGYCPECVESHIYQNAIHDYSYKPYWKEYRAKEDKSSALLLGVELEVSEDNMRLDHKQHRKFANIVQKFGLDCICKNDGSINNGFEIVFHPMTLDYYRKEAGDKLKDMLNYLSTQGYQESKSCGMHVHIGRKGINPQVWKTAGIFMKNNSLFFETISGRPSNNYADARLFGWDEANIQFRGNRYWGLNFCNRDTVEYRLFANTMKVDIFINNLEFVDSYINFCKRHPTEICIPKNFIKWVYCQTSHNYQGLERLLVVLLGRTEIDKALNEVTHKDLIKRNPRKRSKKAQTTIIPQTPVQTPSSSIGTPTPIPMATISEMEEVNRTINTLMPRQSEPYFAYQNPNREGNYNAVTITSASSI